MEQAEQPLDAIPQEESSALGTELLLTDNLMRFFRQNARMGRSAMILLIILAVLDGLFWVYGIFLWQSSLSGDFYLFEGDNARQTWDYVSPVVLTCLFVFSAWTGQRSMQNIYNGVYHEDDNALLDGFDQLTLMKKRFVYWAVLWLSCNLVEEVFLK